MFQSAVVQQFRDKAESVPTLGELAIVSESISRELGFEYLAMLHSTTLLRHTSGFVRFDNYPEHWECRLIGPGMKVIDPILLIARRRLSAFRWSDALADAHLTAQQQAIVSDAARLGIREGITVPANVPGEPEGSITFATGRPQPVSREQLFIADAVGRIAFEAARRIIGYRSSPDRMPHVSKRVRECLYWVASGKTDQDIADILGIGVETVRTYLRSAFRTLDVVSRGQLVHEALRLGLIDFVPSIPPFR